jgi:hypothetical protein
LRGHGVFLQLFDVERLGDKKLTPELAKTLTIPR